MPAGPVATCIKSSAYPYPLLGAYCVMHCCTASVLVPAVPGSDPLHPITNRTHMLTPQDRISVRYQSGTSSATRRGPLTQETSGRPPAAGHECQQCAIFDGGTWHRFRKNCSVSGAAHFVQVPWTAWPPSWAPPCTEPEHSHDQACLPAGSSPARQSTHPTIHARCARLWPLYRSAGAPGSWLTPAPSQPRAAHQTLAGEWPCHSRAEAAALPVGRQVPPARLRVRGAWRARTVGAPSRRQVRPVCPI